MLERSCTLKTWKIGKLKYLQNWKMKTWKVGKWRIQELKTHFHGLYSKSIYIGIHSSIFKFSNSSIFQFSNLFQFVKLTILQVILYYVESYFKCWDSFSNLTIEDSWKLQNWTIEKLKNLCRVHKLKKCRNEELKGGMGGQAVN